MQDVNTTTDSGKRMGVERFTLTELADTLDVSKGYISRRAREGKDVKGHDVEAWAVRDGGGRIDHFRVPEGAFTEQADDHQGDSARENAAADANEEAETTAAKARNVRSISEVAREARERRENMQAARDEEQQEADRKRREQAEQRRNARAEERTQQSDADAHTYTVAEIAKILDTDESTVRSAVADGRDVQAFPVSEFAVMGENGAVEHFRIPSDAFEDDESAPQADDHDAAQQDTPVKERSGVGGLLALGAASLASAAMGAFDK